MKKVVVVILVAIILSGLCLLGFETKKTPLPNNYYQVFLNDKLLGTIRDKNELDTYIDKNGKYYKNKYKVDKVYAPEGLQVKKVTTFSGKVSPVSKVYKQINKDSSFTINGYTMTIKSKNKDENGKVKETKINVLNKNTFKEAVTNLIDTYVGKDAYKQYLDDDQPKIDTTGEIIENVYVDEDITIKETKIPVDETIFTDVTDLSKYLMYGDDFKENVYNVKAGDTIETVAFSNKINPEELLLANDTLTSRTNLLYPGQQLKIVETNPKISVVEESYVVEDVESKYKIEEKYDSSLLMGDEKVTQEGQNGLERVSQNVKQINGEIVYVNPQGKQVLRTPVNKIVLKGSKYVSGVGSLTNWGWPTDSGWRMSSGYVYRNSPVGRGRELHTGLDISGTGYGSKIYATNNGVVQTATRHYSYGNYVVINHNNGYMTLYAHMSRIAVKKGQKVARGQVIGYVGCTGSCTGPHVHYEVWKGSEYHHVNPSILYPGGYR